MAVSEKEGVVAKLKREEFEKRHSDFQAFLPALEEVLVRGNPRQRELFAKHLRAQAQDAAVMAYTLVGDPDYMTQVYQFENPEDDRKCWQSSERAGKLTDVLFYWNEYVLYQYWSRLMRESPAIELFKMGQ
jgi:hypothetical protein